MTARAISIEAYRQHILNGQRTQWVRILLEIRTDPGLTRAELARQTGTPVASVCGRVKELLEAELVQETGRRPCSISGRTATTLGPA